MKVFTLTLTPLQKGRLHLALQASEDSYDPAERMLRLPLQKNATYHTTLKGGWVHPNYLSLVYAVSLLDSATEANLDRAAEILDRVVNLQDVNPASPTYGIWSWFMDEPLEKMSPPDWNYADFCGVQLIEAILVHRPRLASELVQRIDAAIIHAAHSIKRRNVGPEYTNIAIMGGFACAIAGELYDIADLRDYGLARFRTFHAYTAQQGSFTEYNSPHYGMIALNEILRICKYVQDAATRQLAQELYHKGWEEISIHFHAPTKQWGGPHSRAYSALLAPDTQGFLNRATGASFPNVSSMAELYEHRLVHQCPRDLRSNFFALDATRTVHEVFSKTDDGEAIGKTYLDADFTLGTINAGDLWNQRRALVAYWGDETAPKYLHLRCLHDGYDFSAGYLFSSQTEGDVLGGIVFAHDQGDTHVSLDMIKDSTIQAEDIRIRIELGGVNPVWNRRDGSTSISGDLGGLNLEFHAPYAFLDGTSARLETGREEGKAWIDLVLYKGPSKKFHLPSLSSAAVVFALRLTKKKTASTPSPIVEERDGILTTSWEGHRLVLSAVSRRLAELRSICMAEESKAMEALV